jgi:MFS family permease
VFDLSVRATTSFNAVQIIGVVIGMAIAARMIAPRIGKRRTTAAGCVIAAIGLIALATSGFTQSSAELYLGIAAMGFGLGVLNVGSLSLMLDMTTGAAAGLAMGLWTVAHALADGAATAGGGVLHWVGIQVFGSEVSAYASVFAIEAGGLLAVVALLARIDPSRLEEEVRDEHAVRA